MRDKPTKRQRRSDYRQWKLQCDGKVAYHTLEKAEEAAELFLTTSRWPVSPYFCCYCGKYHFGHTPKYLL